MIVRQLFFLLAVLGGLLVGLFFFAPWMLMQSNYPWALAEGTVECVTFLPHNGDYSGLDLARDGGRLTYTPHNLGTTTVKCLGVHSAWYLFWTPVVGITALLTATLFLIADSGLITLRKWGRLAHAPRLYIVGGLVGLIIHAYLYADFWIFPLKPGVVAADVYVIDQLTGFWVSTMGLALILIAGIGLTILSRRGVPAQPAAEEVTPVAEEQASTQANNARE